MYNYFSRDNSKIWVLFTQSKYMKIDAWAIAFGQMLDHELHTNILEMLLLMLPTWQIVKKCILFLLLELTFITNL